MFVAFEAVSCTLHLAVTQELPALTHEVLAIMLLELLLCQRLLAFVRAFLQFTEGLAVLVFILLEQILQLREDRCYKSEGPVEES